MQRLLYCSLLICLAIATSLLGSARVGAATGADATRAGQYIVQFTPESSLAERAALIEARGGHIVEQLAAINAALVAFPQLQPTADAQLAATLLTSLSAEVEVRFVEPNRSYQLADSFTPDDPLLSSQYALGIIHAYEGWAITRGSPSTVIAIIDSGVNLNHPDLSAKLLPGYDLIDHDSVPDDPIGHGTHVAGTAAAVTNNGLGVAGICPECMLLPLRVFDKSGFGSLSDIATAIIYATDRGAKVINLSLVGSGSQALEASLDYAWSKGVFTVCAAGNGATNQTDNAYPAFYNTCFAVAATTSADTRSFYSNYGPWIAVTAPGDSIRSTYLNTGYTNLSGTSMATPQVAGLAGLLASQGLNNRQIRTQICATADPIEGTGSNWRCGRINMARALMSASLLSQWSQVYLPLVAR